MGFCIVVFKHQHPTETVLFKCNYNLHVDTLKAARRRPSSAKHARWAIPIRRHQRFVKFLGHILGKPFGEWECMHIIMIIYTPVWPFACWCRFQSNHVQQCDFFYFCHLFCATLNLHCRLKGKNADFPEIFRTSEEIVGGLDSRAGGGDVCVGVVYHW